MVLVVVHNMKTISTYISTTNALFHQSTIEQTIRQSLLYSDEIIVVNSINSTDGTQNLLDELKSEYPNIIKLYTFKEDFDNPSHEIRWSAITEKKTYAMKQCKGDYVILQDDDECVHEKYANHIKLLPEISPETIGFRFNTIHFYRSFDRYQNGNNWYPRKIYMVKNLDSIKHGMVRTDPDNHIIYDKEQRKYIPLDSLLRPKVINTSVTSYHYGWCRHDAILLYKKYIQEAEYWGKEYWKCHEFPFKLDDPNNLPIFEGTHPKYMIDLIEKENKFNSRQIKHIY